MTISKMELSNAHNLKNSISTGGETILKGMVVGPAVLTLMLAQVLLFSCGEPKAQPEPKQPTKVSDSKSVEVAPKAEQEVEPSAPTKRFSDQQIGELRRRARHEISRLGGKAKTTAMVFDVATNEVLFDYRGDQAAIPASNMKLVVGAATISQLGLDHRFETRFAIDGTFKDGVLAGDLIVIGSGDPTVGKSFFDDENTPPMEVLAKALIDQGLKRIEGRILADEGLFSGPTTGPNWPKDGAWQKWMVEVRPLVYNDNRVTLRAKTERGEAAVSASPDIGFVAIENKLSLTNNKNGHTIRIQRGRRNNKFVVGGRLWRKGPGYGTSVNIHDGSRFYVHALRAALRDQGVVVEGNATILDREIDREKLEDLLVYTSKLERTLSPMLKTSQNLYAEVILRNFGLAMNQDGSFEAGTRAITDWLRKNEILEANTVIADGSGLSRDNRLSAKQMVQVLDYMAEDEERASDFRRLLAEAGKSGTLKKRMTKLRGRVVGKTGTMNGISSLAGYVRIQNGRYVAFAVLCNNAQKYRARKAQDAICAAIAELSL